MAIKDWTTNYPTNLDTDVNQEDLVNNEDNTRVSHVMSLRDAVQELEEIVGSDNLESGSLRKKVDDLESGTINEDVTYYVDGDSGDNANDGLSWGAAKKNLDFLYSDSPSGDAIPRELKADVTVYVRGTVLSTNTNQHTLIDNFYGSGKLKIIGETTDLVTGLTPTGYENTATNIDYHSYIEVSGASWTVDEYQGHYIQFTSGVSNTDALYPIQKNTATRLETIAIPDLDGTETFKIVSGAIIKGAQISAPSTLVKYYQTSSYEERFFSVGCKVFVQFEKLNLNNKHSSDNIYINIDTNETTTIAGLYNSAYVAALYVKNISFNDSILIFTSYCLMENCCLGGAGFGTSVFCPSIRTTIMGTYFYGAGSGQISRKAVYVNNAFCDISDNRFENYYGAVTSEDGGYFSCYSCYYKDCTIAIGGKNGVIGISNYGFYKHYFNNCETAVNCVSNSIMVNENITASSFVTNSVTNELMLSSSPVTTASFSDLEDNKQIWASSGGRVCYIESNNSRQCVGKPQYNNSSSGLDAYTYQEAIDELSGSVEFFNEGYEPNGFVNTADSYFEFDDSTRIFTIAPTGASYSYYSEGSKYTKTGQDTVSITDTEGNWFFYFNGETLTATQSFVDDVIRKYGYVASIYWDATNNKNILLADERHGFIMDGVTHSYLHETRGTQLVSGLALGSFSSDGDGSSNSHAQFGYATGVIRDEDLEFSIDAYASPANIPIFYKSGSSGDWRRKDSDDFPVIRFGTGRLAWNEYTGSTWQQTQVTEGDLVLMHYFATNDPNQPVIGIQGQSVYTDVPSARIAAGTEISGLALGGLPFVEFTAIGTVIFQTHSSYTNTAKARVRTTDVGDDYVDFRDSIFNSAGSASQHGNLSGLEQDDHTQYVLADGTRPFSGELQSSEMYSGYTVGGTNKDVFVDSDGYVGVLSSSERFKQNIVPMEDTIWVKDLIPVNFEYKNTPGVKQYGLIAEQVEQINSNLVTYDKDGYVDGVTYTKLIPILLSEVQKQKELIAQLEDRISKLEK